MQRPELPIQLPKLPIDFNEMQNENENEFDILLADGEGKIFIKQSKSQCKNV